MFINAKNLDSHWRVPHLITIPAIIYTLFSSIHYLVEDPNVLIEEMNFSATTDLASIGWYLALFTITKNILVLVLYHWFLGKRKSSFITKIAGGYLIFSAFGLLQFYFGLFLELKAAVF
ncbi:MAG: hypothetical protein HRU04_23505 [Oceanospirillaceae bacterium]|nr:hypothetical protein [Oceanospirillaceae bacterium]